MKKKINDLLLKMQTGDNCIGETANHLFDLLVVSSSLIELIELKKYYTNIANGYSGGCKSQRVFDAEKRETELSKKIDDYYTNYC